MVSRTFLRYAAALVLGSSTIEVEVHAQSLIASAATANASKVAPKALYPKPSLTRGKAATLNASELSRLWPCPRNIHKLSCSYSQAHRDVPATVKRRVYAEYGVDPRSHMPGEIDHFFPLCAGGSNDITNLWFQPETNVGTAGTTASARRSTLRRGYANKSRLAHSTPEAHLTDLPRIGSSSTTK